MKNVTVTQKGKKLTIEIDTDQSLGASKSGKSQIVATTGGNVLIKGGLTLGLNLYKKP